MSSSQETSSFTATMEGMMGYQLEWETSCSMDTIDLMCVTRAQSSFRLKLQFQSAKSQSTVQVFFILTPTTMFLVMERPWVHSR